MGAGFLAPLLAAAGGGGAAAAAGTAAAATAGTSVLATALPAVSAIATGLAGRAEAKATEEQNRINAYIGKTRAVQTDAVAREGLNSELGELRNAFASSGQRQTVGTEAVFSELRRVRGRDRRIEFNNRMQEASAYNMAAQNAKTQGNLSLLGGVIKGLPSVFDVMKIKNRGY